MNFQNNWDLHIDPAVVKELKRIPCADSERIVMVMRLLSQDPYFGDIQKMKGEHDVWRRRIGSYRLFYKILTDRKIILVFRVERRTSKTY